MTTLEKSDLPREAPKPSTKERKNELSAVGTLDNTSVWADIIPKHVDYEDALGPDECLRIWTDLYSNAKLSGANEKESQAVRAGVYVYSCKNGTSRDGDYAGTITISTGSKVPASVIPKSASRMKIRKFMRGNMEESYNFFKTTRVMESDKKFVAKCAELSIPPECAFATADWLTDCPNFTPAEAKAHKIMYAHSIQRSRRAREGHSLESVEGARTDAVLAASGPNRPEQSSPNGDW